MFVFIFQHLATYFGHQKVMEILLARNDVEVNAVNDNGDTALHKASFIGREVKKCVGYRRPERLNTKKVE